MKTALRFSFVYSLKRKRLCRDMHRKAPVIRMKLLRAAACLTGKTDKAKIKISRLQSNVAHSSILQQNSISE